MRKAIGDFLVRINYLVLEAGNRVDAIKVFEDKGNEIDLVLLDIMMPGKDGIAVLNEMRELSHVPVIMLTAKDKEEDQIEGFRKGADDYIIKPFSLVLLTERVATLDIV